jgi:hypothetical protein
MLPDRVRVYMLQSCVSVSVVCVVYLLYLHCSLVNSSTRLYYSDIPYIHYFHELGWQEREGARVPTSPPC